MRCLVCSEDVDELITAVDRGTYISERCYKCLNNTLGSHPLARKYERDRQREDFRKDILQRFEGDKPDREYIRAYPEKARTLWDEETLHKYE